MSALVGRPGKVRLYGSKTVAIQKNVDGSAIHCCYYRREHNEELCSLLSRFQDATFVETAMNVDSEVIRKAVIRAKKSKRGDPGEVTSLLASSSSSSSS